MEQSKTTDASGGAIAKWLAAEALERRAEAAKHPVYSEDEQWALAQAVAFEHAHAYAMVRPALASAPPAPTPEAGSDLAKLSAGSLLQRLRSDGWSVAVHNDYRLNGEAKTFWLFTHASGRWIKGEGATDDEALRIALGQIEAPTRSASDLAGLSDEENGR